jgi:hypothetical protein
MHGLIFASFSAFIHTRYPDLASAIWESEPRYDSAESYSDDDFTRVLTRVIERTGDGSREILGARSRDRPGYGAPATAGEPVGARRVDQLYVG